MKKLFLLFFFSILFLNSKSQTSAYHSAGGITSTNYIIPVVVHVLHNYGSENISDAQVMDGLRILNEDFQKRNADTSEIVSSFKSIAADCQIEFRLATLDPNGVCTNGIEHIVTSKTYYATDSSKINQWPPSKYLNIWVVNNFFNAGFASYATMPGGPVNADGVMVLSTYLGSIGTGSINRTRMLTGEFGHYFNLLNTWGQGTCGDDSVADTPPTSGSFSGCNLTLSVCNPPIIENDQNFMAFSLCPRMFTDGQKLRMHATLNSSISGRNNLWSPANLTSTGTADPYVMPLCKPAADFISLQQYTCPGYSIKFIDKSWSGHPTSWRWSFQGGIPATSTDSAPSILYNVPGTYDVTLTASNSGGADSIIKTDYIIVMDSTKVTPPVSEDFEGSVFPPVHNYITAFMNGYEWQHTDSAGTLGSVHSMMVDNYNSNLPGSITEFITPSFDFSQTIPSLTFYRAYALRSGDTSKYDNLKIYYSLNCGQTWNLRYSKLGSTMVTASPRNTTYFVPSSTDWMQDSVNIGNLLKGKPDVRFKFQAVNGGGNNIYLDNININGVTGIEEYATVESHLEISPNPASNKITISNYPFSGKEARVEIYNMMGELAFAKAMTDKGGGTEVDVSSLASGIYIVQLMDGDKVFRGKIIKE